ncbi:MAG: biotin transporter BioY [Candidatus Geothermarchaeales archaeon]
MRVLDVSLTAIFAALTMVGSYIYVPLPFTPVPITLQTLFTYLSGAILGGRLGALSQLIYILLGALGLPVYAGGAGGITRLVGPTGGYIIGFAPCAYVSGRIVERKGNPGYVWFLLAISVGTAILYSLGIVVLTYWVGGLWEAILLGVVPFLPGDALKVALASYIALKTRPIVRALIPHKA